MNSTVILKHIVCLVYASFGDQMLVSSIWSWDEKKNNSNENLFFKLIETLIPL